MGGVAEVDLLQAVFAKQRDLAEHLGRMNRGPLGDERPLKSFAYRHAGFTAEEAHAFIRAVEGQALALMMEAAELMDWLPWKHWKKSGELTLAEVRKEVAMESIDALHFLVNIWLLLDVKPEMVWELYFTKNEENARRANRGY
jgi:hypothetical protein